jgi:hypothetical protein
MEIVAVACHDIAVYLFTHADGGLHKEDQRWQPDQSRSRYPVDIPPFATIFYHESYEDYDQYPQGVADIVGYWAELRIFGGVVLFDRGESGTGVS